MSVLNNVNLDGEIISEEYLHGEIISEEYLDGDITPEKTLEGEATSEELLEGFLTSEESLDGEIVSEITLEGEAQPTVIEIPYSHPDLINRDAMNQHPQNSITHLAEDMAMRPSEVITDAEIWNL